MYRVTNEMQCDLVVIGAGGGGLVAAVRAAKQSGKRVLLLEKTERIGGSAIHAAFMRTFESRWQKKRGLESHTEDYIRSRQNAMFWRVNPELAYEAVTATGAFFDWLLEEKPELENLFSPGTYNFTEEFEPVGPQTGRGAERCFGSIVTDAMQELCDTYGVTIMTGCTPVELKIENNRLTGIIVQNENGYTHIACPACILAAGSWIRNRALTETICPNFDLRMILKSPHTAATCTGECLQLAEDAGAFIDRDNMSLRFMWTSGVWDAPVVRRMINSAYPIHVNLNGVRYCSEPMNRMNRFAGGIVQMDQPYGMGFCVFDTGALQKELQEKSVRQDEWESEFEYSLFDGDFDTVQKALDEALHNEKHSVFRADTPAELADKMGVDKKVFLNTWQKYNRFCDEGKDRDFVKEKDTLLPLCKPPFYAIRMPAETLGATGGVLVDARMRVCRSNRDGIIEGLYAVGDMASGAHIRVGDEQRSLLNNLAWALASGFLAGNNAAKQITKNKNTILNK